MQNIATIDWKFTWATDTCAWRSNSKRTLFLSKRSCACEHSLVILA